MKALALIFMVPFAAEAALPDCPVEAMPVASGILRDSLDAPIQEVTGGAYLTDESLICLAKEVVWLRAEVATYEAGGPQVPTLALAAGLGGALVLGVLLGVLGARVLH